MSSCHYPRLHVALLPIKNSGPSLGYDVSSEDPYKLFTPDSFEIKISKVKLCHRLSMLDSACSPQQLQLLATQLSNGKNKLRVSASIVTYKNSPAVIAALCTALTRTYAPLRLLVVDNAASSELESALRRTAIEYIAPRSNVGFGRAHNMALERVKDTSTYHFFVNPDIEVLPDTLSRIVTFLEEHADVGAVMPKVVYPDGSVQRQCKLLPSPLDLLLRRFAPTAMKRAFADQMARYDLCHMDYNQIMEPPVVCGCFLAVRTSVLLRTGGFDPRFFMYLEDFDLCRRIRQHARLVYLPITAVVHEHGKGSYRSLRLLRYHIESTIRYFNKWGWFGDAERTVLNSDEAILGNVSSLAVLETVSATDHSEAEAEMASAEIAA